MSVANWCAGSRVAERPTRRPARAAALAEVAEKELGLGTDGGAGAAQQCRKGEASPAAGPWARSGELLGKAPDAVAPVWAERALVHPWLRSGRWALG